MAQLINILPQFAAELATALEESGHPELARSVDGIEIVERCRCSEPGCVSFYAHPKSSDTDSAECDRIVLRMRGVSCVYHQRGRIVWLEALGRQDDRAILDERLPI